MVHTRLRWAPEAPVSTGVIGEVDRARGNLRRRYGGKGMDFSVRGLATRQLADYRARTPGTFFGEDDHLTLADAYAIQAEVARLRSADGEPVAGYKVGATGPGN